MDEQIKEIMRPYIESGNYNNDQLQSIFNSEVAKLEEQEIARLEKENKEEAEKRKAAFDKLSGWEKMAIYLDDSIEKNIVTGYKIAGRSVGVQLGDLINLIDPTGGKVNDFIASGGDINEFADDNEAGDVYGKWRTNQFKELEKLREKTKDLTNPGVIEGFKEGDITQIAGGISNAIISVIATMGPARLTKGMSLPVQIMSPMYTEFNAEKAKSKYKDLNFEDAITKLYDEGEDDFITPFTLGAIATGFEYMNYKFLTNAIANRARNKGVKRVVDFIGTGSSEGTTEFVQLGLEEMNTNIARGDSFRDASLKAVDRMFSQDGAEAFVQGFIGGTAVGGVGGQINKSFQSDVDNLYINNAISDIAKLQREQSKAATKDVKDAYIAMRNKREEELRAYIKNKRKSSTYITREEGDQLIQSLDTKKDLQSQITKLEKQLKRNIITKEQFNVATEGINNSIKAESEKVNNIRVEANKKRIQDEVRGLQEPLSRTENLNLELISDPNDFLTKVNQLSQKQYTAQDLQYVDGLIIGKNILINETVSAENNAVTVASHEVLHGVVKGSLRGNVKRTIVDEVTGQQVETTLTEDGEKALREFRDSLTDKERNIIQQRIDDNYRYNEDGSEKAFVEYAEEYITSFADAKLKGQLDDNLITKIKNFFKKILRGKNKGFEKIDFKTNEDVRNFLNEYVADRKAGKLRNQFVSMIDIGLGTPSETQLSKTRDLTDQEKEDLVNEYGKEFTSKEKTGGDTINFEDLGGNAYWEVYGKDVAELIQKQGLLDGLILAKPHKGIDDKTFLDTTYAELLPHIKNYKPERKNPDGLFGWINPQIGNKAKQAFNSLTEGEIQAPTVQVGKTTKEGDIKVQVEADIDQTMIDLETMDMSPQAVAKREAQKNKKKKVRKSKLRQDVGIEDGSDIYNSVKNSARQSLILAYQKTRGIENKNDRAAAIVKMIADEYAGEKGLTSGRYTELFKLVKNSLGTKEYLNYLKKHRESIVESMLLADLVQMERNVPDSERIFTKFVKRLTSKQEVQDAVNKGKLPKDALNTIDKGQAVNLYDKIMPTEDQFVGFFNQPGTIEKTDKTGKTYYVRSGLKGTRKDGLSKYMSKAFIFDALMEVRQEPEVKKLLTNEFNAQLDVVELSAQIGREVDLQFSKNKASEDINNAIDNSENTNVYLQIKFSKSHREQYERRLEKNRPDLTEEQRKNAVQSVFDFVDGKEIPANKKAKYEKLAMHYMANGYLILPEDGYKVIEAERVAGIKKIDPFSYKNPNVLIEENVVKKKVKKTNPDDLETFTNKTEYSDGVVVYDVENSKQGQLDVRKVVDTHFGEKANPWCLCARQGSDKSKELDAAFNMWKKYNQNKNGFKIAFHNGNLVSFRDGNNMQWWDRMDKPTKAVIVKGKKVGDGFREVIQVDENKSTVVYTEKQVGDSKTGTYTKKNLDGDIVEITTTKNGYKDGKQLERIDKTYYIAEFTTIYENGDAIRKEEVRTPYKKFKGKAKTETIGVDNDQIRLENITKWKRVIIKESPGKSYVELEGTVNQSMFEQAKNPDAITDPFVRKNFDYLVRSNERYFPLQGKKVSVVKKSKPESFLPDGDVTIDGVLQESKVQFSKSRTQFTELQRIKKPIVALQGKIQSIESRLEKGEFVDDHELFLHNSGILQDMQEDFRRDEQMPSQDLYNIIVSKLPPNIALNADFSSLENFVQFVKKTGMPEIRRIGHEASKKLLQQETQGLKPSEIVAVINLHLKNVGRSTRSGMIDGLTTNRRYRDNVLIPIFGERFVTQNYKLQEKTYSDGSKGEIFLFKNKKGELEAVPMYENIENIKNNARNNPELVNQVNKQAIEAREYVQSIIDHKNLSIPEKLAIIDLISLDQRGPIRKMYKMGIKLDAKYTRPDGSKITSKDLVLEHEITVYDMVNQIQKTIKGKSSQAELNQYRESAYVHVLPKEIDTLLNNAGLKFKGGRMRYTYNTDIINFFADNYAEGIIEFLPENLYGNEKLEDVHQQSRSVNKETKGITILDFDDTLATSSSLIRYTRPDGTTGTLTPEQYASTYEDLLGLGYKFDFSEFNKVVDGKPAPLLNKAKKLAGKFGTKDMFILTARPPQSAPAIQEFLKANGLNIPLENITGLGNSTADAKALWVLDKAAEGYNDFYFADDALQNVQAVQNMLDQIDVKSKVQQARVQFSKSKMNQYFNGILRDVSGVDRLKIFTEAEAAKEGESKGQFRYFVPPNHEDFIGLLYNFMGKGELGNRHRRFFEKTLIKPLNEAYRRLNNSRQAISNNFRKLNKAMPQVRAVLGQQLPNSKFTVEDAIRVYLWNKSGYKIPGLNKQQEMAMVNYVKQYSDLTNYANMLGRVSMIKEGYVTPGDNWQASSIRYDLVDATGRVGRAKFFKEFVENSEIIFSRENLNKIEAIYGRDFRDALVDVLEATITGNNRPISKNKTVNLFLDWVNGSVAATMFFNARSAILQQLSFVNFLNFGDNNIFKAAARFADQGQFWSDFSKLFNSNYLKQRRAGAAFDVNANEIAREVSKPKTTMGKVRAALRHLLDLGFLPTQIGDSFAISIGGASFYRNRVNSYIVEGFSQKEAENKAFADFQQVAEETQQSARPDMVSQIQRSLLGRWVFAFQNVTSQYARIVKKSYSDLVKRRISKGYKDQGASDTANISRIIYYGAVQSVIFYGLQQALFAALFEDDEEEDEKNKKFFKTKKDRVLYGTLDSLLRGSGLYGAVASTLINYARKRIENSKSDSWFKTPAWPELLQIAPPIGIKVRKLTSSENVEKWNKDVMKYMSTWDIDNPLWDAISTGVEGLTNAPINRLYRKLMNLRAGLDSENAWWQRVAVTLGWSRWDVGIENKEVEKVKQIVKSPKFKNSDQIKENIKLRKEDGGCAAVSRSGNRCRNKALTGKNFCTIHDDVEQSESGEKKQCKGRRTNGERCKMQTSSKSGYCYYHD